MARRSNRWSVNEPDGTNFHELVVLPTFMPGIARHENLEPYFPRAGQALSGSATTPRQPLVVTENPQAQEEEDDMEGTRSPRFRRISLKSNFV